MLKKILITILCSSCAFFAFADELTLQEDAPKTYVVKRGDTLWDISGIFLKEPWLWPKLWRMNPDINNPHLIFPGDKLRLVFDADGQPMLVKGKPELKWSPNIRKDMKDANPITIIPLEVLAPYLNYSNVLTEQVLDQSPYILGGDEKYKSNMEGALLYVKGDTVPGQNYGIYHKGDAILDPESGEKLGYYGVLAGTAKAIRAGDLDNKMPSTLKLESSKREVRAGDIILPVNDNQTLPAFYRMQNIAGNDIQARMISSYNEVREFGKFEVVLLNKGADAGLDLGNVLAIKRQSPDVIETQDGPIYEEDASRWYRLTRPNTSDKRISMPKEGIGHLMVFKVQEQTSFAIVLATSKPVQIEDLITTP